MSVTARSRTSTDPQQVGMRAIWVPHSDIPVDQQVDVDVTPDAVAHELLDILDIVDGWRG